MFGEAEGIDVNRRDPHDRYSQVLQVTGFVEDAFQVAAVVAAGVERFLVEIVLGITIVEPVGYNEVDDVILSDHGLGFA